MILARLIRRRVTTSQLEPETTALVAAMTVAPSPAHVAAINSTIVALKSAGLWTKIDYMAAAMHTLQANLLNWKNPELYPATAIGITHVPYKGLTPPSNGIYVNCPTFLLNDVSRHNCHLLQYFSVYNGNYAGSRDAEGSANNRIAVRYMNNSAVINYMATTNIVTVMPAITGPGSLSCTRRSQDVEHRYLNGVLLSSFDSPVAVETLTGGIRWAGGTSANRNTTGAFTLGAGLSDTEMAALHSAVENYINTIAALA